MGTPGGRRRPLTWLLIGLFALSVLSGLALYRPFDAKVNTAAAAEAPEGAEPPPPPLPVKRTTFLVMGVDRRGEDFGRADSMVVVSYDPAAQQLAMVSLARDTWVQIPGHGYDKLNHSYAFGGERLAMSTAQRLLGIPIDHYVTLSFQGFEKIVDALGGVQIDAEKRMVYHDPYDVAMGPDGLVIDIEPGLQKMDGLTALKYARFRMDEEGDLGRVRRQQQVIKALMKTAAQPSVIGRLPQLIPALADAVDTSLSVGEMLKLAASGKDALAHPLKTGTLGGTERTLGGVFYLIPDLVQVRAAAYEILVGSAPSEAFLARARQEQDTYQKMLAEAIANEPPPVAKEKEEPAGDSTTAPIPPAPKTGSTDPKSGTGTQTKPELITVAIIDASGRNLGGEYARKLRAAGFRVARVSKAAKTVQRSVALDHAGRPGVADRLRAVLPKILVLPARDTKAEEAVEIILGTDLAPAGAKPSGNN